MSEPIPQRVEVQLVELRPAAARQAIARPLEFVQAGGRRHIRELTLTIPTLIAPNLYFQARIPGPILQELLQRAGELPQERRADFIREWIIRNQQAITAQYPSQLDGAIRAFRYQVVSASELMGLIPRRVSPPSPPSRLEDVASPPAPRVAPLPPARPPSFRIIGDGSLVNPYAIEFAAGRETSGIGAERVQFRLTVPADGRNLYFVFSLSLSQVTRANFHQTYLEIYNRIREHVRVHLTERPVSSFSVVEEDDMLRAIWLQVPGSRERRTYLGGEPAQYATAPIPGAPPTLMRITEPLPYGLVPVRRAVDRRSPTLRVTGNGTEASPFVVRVAAGRGTDTIGAREFTLPMRVRTYGGVDVYFMFNLTLGQATVRNFHRTYAEIMRQIESQMRIAVSDPNLSYTIPQEEDAMLISIRSRFQDNQEIIQYLDSH